jgi:ribose-phosphate pyrophosphokinase
VDTVVALQQDDMKILTGNGNPALAQRVCDYLGLPLGDVTVSRFPDGEINVKINEDVRGRDIFIMQPTCPPVNENLMELLVMVDAARRSSARRITAVIPYYGYARKDRKEEGRVPITAKLIANLLVVAGVDRVLALDLHATQIQGFFDIPVDHLFSFPVLAKYFRDRAIEDLVVASPDVGGIRMARAFAGTLNAGLVVVDKRRISPEESSVGFIIGEVAGKNVLLVDDMITTGGSLCNAAQALRDAGAKAIYAAAAHAVLCGPAPERLLKSVLSEIVVTDSIPLDEKARALGDRVRVLSVDQLLGEALRRIHINESVSSLFMKQ